MDILFVTSAKKGLSDKQLKEQPLAEDVFMYQLTNVKGIEENQYILRD
jgi:sugar lactone lactonase YvrE